jgi:4-alpha-glucanotransferase
VTDPHRSALRRLARFCGIQLDYWDLWGHHRRASEASLIGALRAMGEPLDGPHQAAETLERLSARRWGRPLDPVTVAWAGEPAAVRLRLPARLSETALALTIELEGGERIELHARGGGLESLGGRVVAGELYAVRRWALPATLPTGYHRLTLAAGGGRHEAHLIAAPVRAWEPDADSADARAWGVSLPLYALRSERSWGAADWTDFRRLIDWTEARGGQIVSTLPMLAGFLGNGPKGDEPGPYEYSPYSPASRLFLNELFIDPESVAELAIAPEARAMLESDALRRSAAELNAADLVDYRRQAALRRCVLEKLAEAFFHNGATDRREAFERFLRQRSQTEDYALFRAVTEREGRCWHQWPEPLRSGRLTEGDADPAAVRYHLYAQWIAHEQLTALGERARRGGGGLYLDMPLGVNADGYDVWRYRDLFAMGAGGGAPPDNFFVKGQDWGFPPLHPERSRAEGHGYLAESIRGMMVVAGALRIDHVMGLHRLYWVPQGMDATEGVYVNYAADEIYAVLTLESQRHRVRVIGENLGTVPPAVPAAMERHAVAGMYVMQFSVQADGEHAIAPPPPGSVASLNTHDTPTFAGWWAGRDLDIQLEMGLIDADDHRDAHEHRGHVRDSMLYFLRRRGLLGENADTAAVLRACLRWLAAEPAGLVLVSLEDLWLETQPQNVPGTGQERPNWRRRASQPFGAWTASPEYVSLAHEINEIRRASQPQGV